MVAGIAQQIAQHLLNQLHIDGEGLGARLGSAFGIRHDDVPVTRPGDTPGIRHGNAPVTRPGSAHAVAQREEQLAAVPARGNIARRLALENAGNIGWSACRPHDLAVFQLGNTAHELRVRFQAIGLAGKRVERLAHVLPTSRTTGLHARHFERSLEHRHRRAQIVRERGVKTPAVLGRAP